MKNTILITAYAVNPYKGSEDGIAWNIIRQMARHNKVIALTRENNQLAIDAYLQDHPLDQDSELEFTYFDLPYWLRFWKKGGRGALLYHYLWHLAVAFFIKKQSFQFDIAHHLNFNNDWTPSFLWILGKPLVWGPIGHHPKIPSAYIQPFGKKAAFMEHLKWLTKKAFWTIDPFLKITKKRASKIIGMNTSVQQVLNVDDEKIAVIPAAGTEPPPKIQTNTDQFIVLSVGRFVALKGFEITVQSFAKFYQKLSISQQAKAQLVLIGKGKALNYLQQLEQQYNLPQHAIKWINWIERDQLAQYYASAKVFLFPSHEGAGMVVPEALSYGVPVLCFDNYGPGEFINKSCGISFPYSNPDQSSNEFARALEQLFFQPVYQKELAQNAYKRYKDRFTWEGKGEQIQRVYNAVLYAASEELTPVNSSLQNSKLIKYQS